MSKKSGSYQLDCYRLQVFKEQLNEPLDRRIPISETSGSSSDEPSDSSESDTTPRHYSEDEKRERLQEREKDRMKENKRIALELVKLASREEGLMNMWEIPLDLKENQGGDDTYILKDGDEKQIYWMFVDTCVVHTIPRKVWKDYHINKRLSDYVKTSNEAFAMLVLENIAPDLVDANGNWVEEEVSRKLSTSRYTKGKGGRGKNGRMKGWRTNGIKRYNKLVENVLLRRKVTQMQEVMEDELRKHYKLEMEQNEEAEQELNDDEGDNNGRFTGAFDLSTGDETLSNGITIPAKYANIKMVCL